MRRYSISLLIVNCSIKVANKDEEEDEWEYLKKTVQQKDGKQLRYRFFNLSDEFIKYHQITEKIIEDEDEIVNSHMNIIKVIN